MAATVAVQVSSELIEDFARATAPRTDAWLATMRSASWYIDIPHRALLVGDHEVRAIFTQGTAAGQVMAVAILTTPASNKLSGRCAWVIDDPSPVLGLSAPEIDLEYLAESLDNLIKLISLYRLTASRAAVDVMPMVSIPQLERLPAHKQRARQKTHSLFRVERISTPADRFGRARASRQGTWTLTHRVPVHGHFRWQPYGERSSLRRLQWIAAHWRGPESAGEKTEIERLRLREEIEK